MLGLVCVWEPEGQWEFTLELARPTRRDLNQLACPPGHQQVSRAPMTFPYPVRRHSKWLLGSSTGNGLEFDEIWMPEEFAFSFNLLGS
jgi:hypothetical protein